MAEPIQPRAGASDLRRNLVRSRAAGGTTALKVARGLGWTFIWMGVFLLGFVVHQLFVTDFFAQRAQRGLEAELGDRIDIAPVAVPYDRETGEVGAPSPTLPDNPGTAPLDSGSSTGITPTGDISVEPLDRFLLREPVPDRGEPVGKIRIPDVGLVWTVVEGVSRSNLKAGAGHMPETPLPGQPGNAVVSGHRTTFGAPFGNLDQLEPGDRVYWDSPVIGGHTYVVRETRIVRPTEVWVIGDLDVLDGRIQAVAGQKPGTAWLTLTTCHPKFSARQRLIVFAELVDGPNAPVILGEA